MSKELDNMLYTEMIEEDQHEIMTDNFDILDLFYDDESDDPFSTIFSKDIDAENDIGG